jgi:hypothetical protein
MWPPETNFYIHPPGGPWLLMNSRSASAASLEAYLSQSPPRSSLNDITSTGAWVTVKASISGVWQSVLQHGGTVVFGTELNKDGCIADGSGLHAIKFAPQPGMITGWELAFDVWVPDVLLVSSEFVMRSTRVHSKEEQMALPPPAPQAEAESGSRARGRKLEGGAMILDDRITLADVVGKEPKLVYMSIQTYLGDECASPPYVLRTEIKDKATLKNSHCYKP